MDLSLQSPIVNDRQQRQHSMVVIPYPQSGKPFQVLNSFEVSSSKSLCKASKTYTFRPVYKIDGPMLLQQFSLDSFIKTLANVPELETLVDLMHDVSVGDIYLTVFPKGIIHTINESILKRLGLTTISLKKTPLPGSEEGDNQDQDGTEAYDDVSGEAADSPDDMTGTDVPVTTARLDSGSSTEPPNKRPQYVDANVLIQQWLQKWG